MKKLLILLLIISTPCLAANFNVQSSSWKDGQTMSMDYVFNNFGCTGKNISPQISWNGEPAGTKSYAITVYDPDAPTGSGWWHWTVFNIPVNVHQLDAGAGDDPAKLPAGAIEGRTDFGKPGYGGACPPAGDKPHHYILTVFALKTDKIDLNSDASGALVGYYLNQNTLSKASITVKYGR